MAIHVLVYLETVWETLLFILVINTEVRFNQKWSNWDYLLVITIIVFRFLKCKTMMENGKRSVSYQITME